MPRPRKKGLTQAQVALKYGFRSGLEKAVAALLSRKGVPFEYETLRVPFIQPAKRRTYTPDFILLDNGIVVESKGQFLTADRSKHKMLKEQYPDLDIRFVFSNSRSKIGKQSRTTYGNWCETHGFLYADKEIPQAWIDEPPNKASLAVIETIRSGTADKNLRGILTKLKDIYSRLCE